MIRAALIAVVATLVLAGGISARAQAYGWSYDRLMQRIDGASVAVAARRYRIDRELVVCNGVGRVIRVGREHRWRRFICTQTFFRHGQTTDVTFGVRVVDEARFRITGARYGP